MEASEHQHELLVGRHSREVLPGSPRGDAKPVRTSYHVALPSSAAHGHAPTPPPSTSPPHRARLARHAPPAPRGRGPRRHLRRRRANPSRSQSTRCILRNTLAHAGAVLEVTIGSGSTENVVVKELQRHPVRGDIMHADLLRVDMKVAIQTHGHHRAARRRRGPRRHRGRRALPGAPRGHRRGAAGRHPRRHPGRRLAHGHQRHAARSRRSPRPRASPSSTTRRPSIATITPPTLEPVEDEIETETELVGEDGEVAEAPGRGRHRRRGRAAAGSGERANASAESLPSTG